MAFIRLTEAFFATAIFSGFLILVLSIFWGRKFCGYICPLGTIQEAVYRFDKKRCYRKKRLPFYLERKFAKLKYLILIITSIMVIRGVAYLYMNYCPVMAISRLPFLHLRSIIVILSILIAGYFVERIWCRFLCPYAALLNVFLWLGKLFGIKRKMVGRNLEKCNDCGVCASYCPMNINILEEEFVSDPNCIHCYICAEACPKKGIGCN